MSRTRSRRPYQMSYGNTKIGTLYTADGYGEHMYESSYPGSCSVNHFRIDEHINLKRDDGFFWRNGQPDIYPIPVPTKLDWGKIPSSSEFGIIQFFAELDDTLAMFGKRFWQELSYGSFTWGVLPFVADVKALLTTLANLSVKLEASRYEDAFTESVTVTDWNPWGALYYNGSLQVKYHLYGALDTSFQNPVSRLLDRLGFHPDLSTAWDLVPLSFVVDWMLPVGDFLDGLRGGGWIKAAYFTGWQTAKWEFSGTVTDRTLSKHASSPFGISGFKRHPYSNVLFIEPTIDLPDLQMPSFRQMFNMAYIFGTRRS